MEHLWLLAYLVSFVALFFMLIQKYQRRGRFGEPVARGLFAVQAAFCFDVFINLIYRYMGINLHILDPVYRRLPYVLIMASHFLLLFGLLYFLLVLLKIRPRRLHVGLLVVLTLLLFSYDQFFPRYDRSLHPWFSPVDYLFYLSVLFCGVLYLRRSGNSGALLILGLSPFIVNEQLRLIPLPFHFIPLTAAVIALGMAWELKRLKDNPAGERGLGGEVSEEKARELGLSPRERDIVNCLLLGLDNNAIAGKLFIAPSTVKTHFTRIFRKLGVASRLELVQFINSRLSD